MKSNALRTPAEQTNETIESLTAQLFVRARKQGRSGAAFKDLIQRIEERLYRFSLFLTRNPETARDLAQETYLKVLENFDTLTDPDTFVSWMFKVTKNRFIDYLRSEKIRSKHKRDSSEYESMPGVPKTELALQIERSLAKLDPEDRFLVLLICLEGYSYKECAELLDTTEDSVKSKLCRLRKSVKGDFLTNNLKIIK